jgi:MoaA/NifB/PqqE/SkfB family radical SAM enzyme
MSKTGAGNISHGRNPDIKSGFISSFIASVLALQYIILALLQYRSVRIAREVLRSLLKLKNDFLGDKGYGRMIYTGGKFYFNMHVPGFPSKLLLKQQLGELNRIRPVRSPSNRLRIVFLSITNKCPLQCRHCYEWENLNKPDILGVEDYKAIISKFTDKGVGQFHFGGGEPMLNYPVLLELTKFLKGKSETWIATSGPGLSYERARELRRSGLTGAAISVDHFDAAKHNDFRGSDKSFMWAMDATENSVRAGLVTCWSICLSREFVSSENLYRYASLAGSLGVHFIQVFEPFPVGRFKGHDILLPQDQLDIVEDFYINYNASRNQKGMPLMTYHGYYLRRLGCLGGGNRYLYIDASGFAQACPFCRNESHINLLELSADQVFQMLAREECIFDSDLHKERLVGNPIGEVLF